MFIEPIELETDLYEYQVEQITEGNTSIVIAGITAGIEEAKSYFTSNNQKEFLDGRPRYDAEGIFSKSGNERNPLVLALTKDIAVWHILGLNNTDALYDRAEKRYDYAIKYFEKVQKGKVNISNLPLIPDSTTINNSEYEPYQMGSRKKFRHE
jgi:hypothetical protein